MVTLKNGPHIPREIPEPYTIPSRDELKRYADATPDYMRPALTPVAVVREGHLDDEDCNAILDDMKNVEPYNFTGCNGTTREALSPLSPAFNSLRNYTEATNRIYWGFNLYSRPGAWLQTYKEDGSYQMHTDGVIGQTRKLTTVAMLTDPCEYEGGELHIVPFPVRFKVPKTRGTVVTFPAWVLHQVTEITHGTRQTINLGYWGPPFK